MRIAIITGATSGMGREFALTLKDHINKLGQIDQIWAIARSEDKLQALAAQEEFAASGITVRPISLDLSKTESYEKLEEMLRAERPTVGLLINASGFGKFEFTMDTDYKENLNMVDLNCKAVLALCQIAIPYMSDGSKILNIASVAAFQPIPGINTYAATKAFALQFTRALNQELKLQGKDIQAMALCPFWTKTGFFDRAIQPGDPLPIVKKYTVMYEAADVVAGAWKALFKGKDAFVYGTQARLQVLGVKLLPHKLVMKVWINQQKLRTNASARD